jgi:hypothetical protein
MASLRRKMVAVTQDGAGKALPLGRCKSYRCQIGRLIEGATGAAGTLPDIGPKQPITDASQMRPTSGLVWLLDGQEHGFDLGSSHVI